MIFLNRQTPLLSALFARWRMLVVLMCVSTLSACGSGPPPKLYLLDSTQTKDSQATESQVVSGFKSLGMSVVELPGYVTDTQIATVHADGKVSLDARNRWAEEPEEAISRMLAERLRDLTNATVLIEPWPREYAPTARVEVVFDKLLREPLGGADIAGQVLLLSGDGRKLLKAIPFQFVHYGRNPTMRTFFMAVAQGIEDIAIIAVQALQAAGVKS